MTILCISGSRADYGYLKPVADALGVEVADFASLTAGNDDPRSIAVRSLTFGSMVAERIAKAKPSMLVVVGDRWEILSACQAAVLAGVPIAHIGAGEETRGSYDDRFRAAIEALADLHFCLTNKAFARRMGDGILAGCTSVHPPETIPPGNGSAILALYPETRGADLSGLPVIILRLLESRGLNVVPIIPNPDVGAGGFNGRSMPLNDFQDFLLHANVIVGNSSAGIIEAPILGTPSVNIGTRQDGRPQASSIFQAWHDLAEIEAAIDAALAFGKQRVESPYYRPNAVQIIAEGIRNYLEERNGNPSH